MFFSLAALCAITTSHVLKGAPLALETSKLLRRSDSSDSSGFGSRLTSAGSTSSSAFSGASISSASDASTGRIVDPHWWLPYSDYYGKRVPQIFWQHTIVVSEFQKFIDRIEAAKQSVSGNTARRLLYKQSPQFSLEDYLALFEKPFNSWKDFDLREKRPHALTLAGARYEQDRVNLLRKEEIFERLLRMRRP
ncbi:uncharacterized protein UTRI_04874_B [Ustilago trichophora]|uniref:Uncharacterized protein n=1 Tax=Ustilago trichophora TaxID=86804 RepID=A0A5C3EFW3_9BASI|nr:uncharacterized protein UTRI_04874_B [Ustilago trichophora]